MFGRRLYSTSLIAGLFYDGIGKGIEIELDDKDTGHNVHLDECKHIKYGHTTCSGSKTQMVIDNRYGYQVARRKRNYVR